MILKKRVVPQVYAALLLSAVFASSVAAQVIVSGALTNIRGLDKPLISYRNQEHMFITDDGFNHLVVNQSRPFNAISVWSNLGTTAAGWFKQLEIADSANEASSDAYLDADGVLHLVYNSDLHDIRYRRLTYDPSSRRWFAGGPRLVATKGNKHLIVPSFAIDDGGRYWCSYTEVGSFQTVMRVAYSDNGGATWSDTGTRWGTANDLSAKGSRLLALPGRMGLLYTDQTRREVETTLTTRMTRVFVEHSNSDPPGTWGASTGVYAHVFGDDTDPRGTHYSTLVDSGGFLHFATPDDDRLVYRRYDPGLGTWTAPRALSEQAGVLYMQLAEDEGGDLFLTFNLGNIVKIKRSSDGGDSWADYAFLLNAGGSSTRSPARVETAGRLAGRMLVLQQTYVDSSRWPHGLAVFDVP